ncbi:MAG: tyrosine-type recombinase/integrase [Gemmatimonadota bacterium]|nr:tyrosine-type recombinase/integrase [Gemmatimonadota bacterium]
MITTYDVRIHKTEIVPGGRGNSYRVRWAVAGRRWKEPFRSAALADSFRSELVAASRKGQAFDTATGRPVVLQEMAQSESWYVFACSYVDMKWPDSAGKSRMGIAETLATVTPVLVEGRGRPSEREMRAALYGWAFNARARSKGEPSAEVAHAIRWLEQHTVQVPELAKPNVIRAVLARLGQKLDGSPAAASTVGRKRAVFHNALEYAVERELLAQNPLSTLKTRKSRTSETVDKRVVVSPAQAVRLLDAVRSQGCNGRHLVAFFGLLYYGALRPAEAAALGKGDLTIPGEGWGELYLPKSAPTTGAAWGDSGKRRDRRGLKHRPRDEVRVVPCAPPLTELLHRHLTEFGTGNDGRLIRGVRSDDLSDSTYGRVWQNARALALTPDEVASPLARRPYDLRHAAVSTWLNGGVPATQVAEWAGHSVAVLLRVYAKCIAGQGDVAREQIGRALGLG